MVSKQKWERLKAWMSELEIQEEDLSEQFIVGSGRGGQNLHKTSSTVLLVHQKSNTQIKCQQSRSQETNRYYARVRLCEKLDLAINQEKSKEQREREKIRKQKKRRKKRHKDIHAKKHQATLKRLRQPPSLED